MVWLWLGVRDKARDLGESMNHWANIFEHLPGPGKRQLNRGEGGLGLEFQWSGFHPRLFIYHLCDMEQFMSLMGLSFLSVKWC